VKVTRKISTSGKYSKVIILPKEYLRELGWRENQLLELQIDTKGKRIIVKDAKKK